MAAIAEHRTRRRASRSSGAGREPDAGAAPVLYVHGVPPTPTTGCPSSSAPAGVAPDLPGFGRSAKPADFDYSIAGYDRCLEAFLDHAGIDRFSLVVHDWGAVGLAPAQRLPERVERLVVIDAVPFLPGYGWHRVARLWRTPVVGELAMGFTTRFAFKRSLREADRGARPAARRARWTTIWRALRPRHPAGDPQALPARRPEVLEAGGRATWARIELPGAGALGRQRPLHRPPRSARPTPRRSGNGRRSRCWRAPATGRGSTGPSWCPGVAAFLRG